MYLKRRKYNVFAILLLAPSCFCVTIDVINCGVDHEVEVAQGNVDITQYPWLGVLYYTYYGDVGETRAVTPVVLIHKEFVVANAADIGPMPKYNFRKKTRVLLGQRWSSVGRRVRNYVLHPQYGETYNTLALVQLKDRVENSKIIPLCPPPERLRNPVFYVMKFDDDFSNLKKQVIPVAYVPGNLCKEFYVSANLYSKKMRPPYVACAVSLDEEQPCVWGAGSVLVTRDVWGRWVLLGLGVRGPGCGAPSRYLDIGSYWPWVTGSLAKFQQITISKISKQKYVLRSGGDDSGAGTASQRFGNCDPEEKVNLIYRELIRLVTDNNQYQFLTYNISIKANVEYTCLTLDLTNASAVSEMHVKHICPRATGAACYQFSHSIFSISVYIMFSDACLFEMYAWGFEKNMTLLDIQEWKWEEATYYDDFSLDRSEYRGPGYMTEFGFEPLDKKMWVPEYDLWTTSTTINTSLISVTTPIPGKADYDQFASPPTAFVYKPTQAPTTTPTTPPPTKRTFKRKRIKTTTKARTTTARGWLPDIFGG